MKAFISIDMEGICGVVREIETHPTKGGEAYQQSRRLMTQEGNAAIEGCLKAGATEVLIADSHWNFDNLIPEELHEGATLLRGTPRGFSMVQDLDASYDAALFVGYHAKASPPLRAKTPVQMIVEFRGTYAADRAAMIPTVRRVGGLRFEFEAADYPEAFRTFYAMVTIAGGD